MQTGEPLDHGFEEGLNLIALQLVYPVLHAPDRLLVVLGARMEEPYLRFNPLERGDQVVNLADARRNVGCRDLACDPCGARVCDLIEGFP
jgi:hypothetical protein